MQKYRRLPCSQKAVPPHFLHSERLFPCSQTRVLLRSLPCSLPWELNFPCLDWSELWLLSCSDSKTTHALVEDVQIVHCASHLQCVLQIAELSHSIHFIFMWCWHGCGLPRASLNWIAWITISLVSEGCAMSGCMVTQNMPSNDNRESRTNSSLLREIVSTINLLGLGLGELAGSIPVDWHTHPARKS